MRSIVCIVFGVLLASNAVAIDPPQGLSWGVSYQAVKDHLAAKYPQEEKTRSRRHKKGVRIEGLKQSDLPKGYREYSELALPDGFFRAEIKELSVMSEEPQRTYAVFDSDTNLVAFDYILKWDNDGKGNKGMRKCWVFHEDIKKALIQKLGEPELDETHELIRAEDMPSGTKYVTRWTDSDDSTSVSLEITRQTHNVLVTKIDAFLIFVVYSSPNMKDAKTDVDVVGDEL